MIHEKHTQRWKHLLWCGILLFPLMSNLLLAQGEPITVTVTALPPYSPDLTLWESNPDKVLIRLTNRSSESHQVRLSGFAENLNGSVRIVTKDNFPRNQITVGPNATVNLNLRDLQLFTADAVDVIGAEKNTIARTKRLPEGSYRICVRALEFSSRVPLSPQAPSGCATFVIRLAESPRPLLPKCGTTIKALKPQLVNFQWSVPAGGPGNIQYRFEMAEVPKGVDPNDALHAKTSPILFTRTVNTPILSYSSADPPLRIGQRYAWRVQTIDPAEGVVFRNEGYSEVCSFVFGEAVPLIGDAGGIDIGINTDGIRIDTGTRKNFIEEGEIIRVKDLRSLEDIIIPACITLSPRIDKNSRQTATSPPWFQVEVQPAINPNAITGGSIQIWEGEDNTKLRDIRTFDERKQRTVFEGTFTGHGLSDLRHRRSGNISVLDLMYINRKGSRLNFTPESGKSYRWRVTLNFNGQEIRSDGTICNFNQAVSPFGKFPDTFIAPNRPDTLVAAGFEIVVEQWDASSKSEDASRPSGIGRIKFDCDAGPTIFTPIPWGPGDLTLAPYEFEVVGVVDDPAKEFSVPEARIIDGASRTGDYLTLLMPDRSGEASTDEGPTTSATYKELISNERLRDELIIDRNLVLDLFGKKVPDGIRVAFRDVKWNGPVQPKVVLTEGIAVYPSPTPIPTPPARLNLENGFQLDIDSLTIEPSEARVEGNLLLPPSIITTDTCTFATLPVPETKITKYCEFYIESNDSTFGIWAIGESGVEVQGRGYVLDFSSTKLVPGLVPSPGKVWKGVVLREGETPGAPGYMVSNRGYTKAEYDFENARINEDGFAGKLTLAQTFNFTALDPYGYRIYLSDGALELSASAIDTGRFKNGEIWLPEKAVAKSPAGGNVIVHYKDLYVQKDMDFFAKVEFDEALVWGEKAKHPTDVHFYELSQNVDSGAFYLASFWKEKAFFPVMDTLYTTPFLGMPETELEGQEMQGVTFPNLRSRDFLIYTNDIPDSSGHVLFPEEIVAGVWMNVGAQGVHTELILRPNKDKPGDIDVGPTWAGYYQADSTPFKIIFADLSTPNPMFPTTHYNPDYEQGGMRVQFVESAVWRSNLSGVALLEGPIGMPVLFRDMMFTSTANNAGGKVDFTGGDTLAHWGVEMVQKDTATSAGIMAVKQGVIYLTAAGIAEKVHFDQPFWLTWGEMEASGNFGRLFFDYNNVGQRFDDFGYSTEFVALSPYDASIPADSGGYIQTYGSLSIPFFGAKMMSISDHKSPMPDTPFFNRFVRVLPGPHLDAGPSDLHWERSWAGGIADMAFDMLYDTVRQDGFVGPGDVSLFAIDDGDMNAFLRMSSSSSCFRVIETSQHGFDIGPIVSVGRIAEIWGCGCIENGTLRQIALGGQLSHSATSTVLQARTADAVSLVFSYRPDRLTFYANGQMFVNVGGSDVDVFGLTHFTVDWNEGYAEGYLKGTVSLGAVVGIPIVAGASSGISGFGEFGWHAGIDYQSIQGRVGVSMYNMAGGLGFTVGGGTTLETGVYLGINAPKNKAWVMDGINGRFGLNKGGLPDRLTGFYAYLGISQGIDLFIVSGGYQVYVGVGAFAPSLGGTPSSGGVIGNVGIYVWGKILGGLVSAAAWGNLQMIAAIPPAFEGSLGLEACVLWVFCGSVSIHAGFNQNDGFYLY